MERNEIIKFWGRENLRRWPEQDLRDLAIPDSSKSFLVDVGLPISKYSGCEFEPLAGSMQRLKGKPRFLQIGSMGFSPVFLDEQGNGRVMTMDSGPGIVPRPRYMNASVEQFVVSLIEYTNFLKGIDLTKESARPELAEKLENGLRETDLSAVSDPEGLWATVVWEIKNDVV